MIQELKEKFVHWWGWPGTRPWLFEKMETYYYNVKYTIVNYYKYAKIVARYRPWDYMYILCMMKFQLEDLCHTLEKYGLELDEYRLPKIARMKRAIELLNNYNEDNAADRCGYNGEAKKLVVDKETHVVTFELQPGYENYNESEIFEKAKKLEEEEWDELFEILKKDLQGWWD